MLRSLLLIALLLAPSVPLISAEPTFELRVTGDWGGGSAADVKAVCHSAGVEFFQHFGDRKWEPITIAPDKAGPLVVYGRSEQGERRVLLNTRDTYWSQYAFQVSHEYCHIACNYRDSRKENLWFEESLCETASLFTLRSMARSWAMKPPYPNWKDYGASLAAYAGQRIAEAEPLKDQSLAEWQRAHSAELRKNPTDRAQNQVVAVALLPLFEKEPSHWRAVGYLNQAPANEELSFDAYLRDWRRRAPAEHQPFISQIGKLFELELE
jgi:hypothetical protein